MTQLIPRDFFLQNLQYMVGLLTPLRFIKSSKDIFVCLFNAPLRARIYACFQSTIGKFLEMPGLKAVCFLEATNQGRNRVQSD